MWKPRKADTVKPQKDALKQQEHKRERREDYDLYRQRMQHEDNLIGTRVSWLVSSQAFLLTPYVLIYLKVVDIATVGSASAGFQLPSILLLMSFIEYVIVMIGLISCALTIRGTAAAFRSKVEMTYDFLSRHKPDGSFEPGVGLTRKEGVHGASAPRGFPVVFTIVWLLLARIPLEILRPLGTTEPAYWPYLVFGTSMPVAIYVFWIFITEVVTTGRRTKETLALARNNPVSLKLRIRYMIDCFRQRF